MGQGCWSIKRFITCDQNFEIRSKRSNHAVKTTGLEKLAFLVMRLMAFNKGLLPEVSFEPGIAISEQLTRWVRFSLLTSFGYDLPRGILTATLLFFLANPLLKAMRRMTKKANFSKPVVFTA